MNSEMKTPIAVGLGAVASLGVLFFLLTRYGSVSTRWFSRLSAFGFCELGIEGTSWQLCVHIPN